MALEQLLERLDAKVGFYIDRRYLDPELYISKVCDAFNTTIIECDFEIIRGFWAQNGKQKRFVFVNKRLSKIEQLEQFFHEVAHIIQGKEENLPPFLRIQIEKSLGMRNNFSAELNSLHEVFKYPLTWHRHVKNLSLFQYVEFDEQEAVQFSWRIVDSLRIQPSLKEIRTLFKNRIRYGVNYMDAFLSCFTPTLIKDLYFWKYRLERSDKPIIRIYQMILTPFKIAGMTAMCVMARPFFRLAAPLWMTIAMNIAFKYVPAVEDFVFSIKMKYGAVKHRLTMWRIMAGMHLNTVKHISKMAYYDIRYFGLRITDKLIRAYYLYYALFWILRMHFDNFLVHMNGRKRPQENLKQD